MSKDVSWESLSELLGSSKGETSGVAPVGRGGAFGVSGVGLVGKFWNSLCCFNWAFCKVLSFNLYSCNKCSVCCRILGELEFTLKLQNYSFNESPYGPEINWNIFFPVWWLGQHFFFLTWCQISKSKLSLSRNQGLHLTTVWREASINWCKTKSHWPLNKWWSKVEKWWGFLAVWSMS